MNLRDCLQIALGFLCSFSFSLLTAKHYILPSVWYNKCYHPSQAQFVRYQNLSFETNSRRLVLISIMTHLTTIKARAVAIQKTWGQDIHGKVIYFIGETGNKTDVELPLIVLPVMDDVYPPQEKAMVMLKYVYEHYGDSFQWFIRADDDVYINSDNLFALLISISSNDDILLGHPGIGKSQEKGKLGLEDQSNFCIGGTGIVMSRSVLKKVYPHLDYCIKNTATAHEDSEVGRCMKKFVDVQCPWGYEASEIFYQDYGDYQKAYHGDLDLMSFEKAVSLHPVKNPDYLFRLHVHFLNIKQRKRQNRERKLKERIKNTKKMLSVLKSNHSQTVYQNAITYNCRMKQCDDFQMANVQNASLSQKTWSTFHEAQSFSVQHLSRPVEAIRGSKAKILQLVTEKAKLTIIEEEKPEIYDGFYFGKVTVGYTRESPIRGNLYQVHFTVRMKRFIDGQLKSYPKPRRVQFKQSYDRLISQVLKVAPKNELINIILPCKANDSLKSFEDFLRGIEQLLERFHETLRVFVVIFQELIAKTELENFMKVFGTYRKRFGDYKFVCLKVNSKFSLQTALREAGKRFSKNQLLLFIEKSSIIDADFLARCRQNTRKGTLYFPLALKTRDKKNAYQSGEWDFPNYSTFCARADDVMMVRDVAVVNRSSEQPSLIDIFIGQERYTHEVFRAPDPGLLLLDSSRPPCMAKYNKTCKDRFDSTKSLLEYIIKKNYVKDDF